MNHLVLSYRQSRIIRSLHVYISKHISVNLHIDCDHLFHSNKVDNPVDVAWSSLKYLRYSKKCTPSLWKMCQRCTSPFILMYTIWQLILAIFSTILLFICPDAISYAFSLFCQSLQYFYSRRLQTIIDDAFKKADADICFWCIRARKTISTHVAFYDDQLSCVLTILYTHYSNANMTQKTAT